jgi:hypothetical protein
MKVRFDFTTVKHQSASLLAKLCPDSPKVHEWRTKSFQIDRKHPAPGFFLQNPGNLLYYQSRGLVYMKESKTIQAVPGSGVVWQAFRAAAPQTVPVLTNENELPIAGNRNRIHPFRIFENVVFGNRIPVRQHDGFPAHRKPRTVEKILALQYFHFFLFGHFTLFKRNGKFTQNFPGCKTISGNRTDTGKSGTKNVILRGKPRQKQNLSRFSIYLRIFAANL